MKIIYRIYKIENITERVHIKDEQSRYGQIFTRLDEWSSGRNFKLDHDTVESALAEITKNEKWLNDGDLAIIPVVTKSE